MTQFQIKETSGAPPFFYKDWSEKTRPSRSATTRPYGRLLRRDTVFPTDLERTTGRTSRRPLAPTNCATDLYVTEIRYRTRSTRFVGRAPHLTRSSRDSLYLSVIAGSDRGARAAPDKRGRRPFARIPAETTRGA